ncbi:3-hydroxyacyl-CoA dehydrogenase family protein [Acidocella sp.]|uniref:3-hydroxyacyl-CoA dehydrogenase family protein n=1 Tax=Acidocella sp. TaxID=50710 RepID=UPI00344ECCD6
MDFAYSQRERMLQDRVCEFIEAQVAGLWVGGGAGLPLPYRHGFGQAWVARGKARPAAADRGRGGEEVTVRTLYTIVNEGAKILEEGIAQRASDIDIVWVYGYGWPRHTGGPMFWADAVGLANIVAGLREFEHRLGDGFSISNLLLERAAVGGRFNS